MTIETEPDDGILRRTVLKASALGAVALAAGIPAAASADDGTRMVTDHGSASGDGGEGDRNGRDEGGEGGQVDEPDGFEVEILAEHAPFPDELVAAFSLTFADPGDEGGEPIDVEHRMDEESTMVVAEVTWEPGGTSGWHRHPGVVLVSTLEGELEVTWERDCVPRTYAAGDGWFDPGVIHNADNASDDESARAYAIFLGVPDGEPATEWVEPVEC